MIDEVPEKCVGGGEGERIHILPQGAGVVDFTEKQEILTIKKFTF